MLAFDDNVKLKILAWFLRYPLGLFGLFLKLFVNRKPNEWDIIQAPQNPRTIVITGASQGIGEGLVEYYYQSCPSCQTIVLISRSREKLEAVKNRLNSSGDKQLVIYPCDVGDADAMKTVLLNVQQTHGPIDIVFANAGLSFRQHSLSHSFDQAVRDTFNVNINGVLNTVMPLIESKSVRQIALVSSQAAYAPLVSPIYGATKQCVVALGYDLRRLLAKDRIAVNVISPGPVRTPMLVGSQPNSVKHGVTTAQAAEIIYDGLRRNQAEIVFPAVTGVFQYALSLLPNCIAEPVAAYVLRRH